MQLKRRYPLILIVWSVVFILILCAQYSAVNPQKLGKQIAYDVLDGKMFR